MTNSHNLLHRREFLKGAAAAGLWSLLPRAQAAEPPADAGVLTVPRRPFGRTGYSVSMLALGGMFDIPNNQLMLRRCLQAGVTYWDTADCYEGGRSEQGIGRFFAANADARKKVFLVTKSDARDPAGMTHLLNRSMERMQTNYIDLYFLHGVRRADELSDEVKSWAERAKKEGKIRLFGFSTHSNMEQNLDDAAKLGWIDAIMFAYNFRLMNDARMKRAVDACSQAGIGLTVMKTQGGGPIKADDRAQQALATHFLAQGFTAEQAKLKAVWSNPQIASICSQMPNLRILNANIAAALDRTELTRADFDRLMEFDAATAGTYCAGCAHICEAASGLPASDIMRCWMYAQEYGMPEHAAREFAARLSNGRFQLTPGALRAAEAVCPRHLPIAALVMAAFRRWDSHRAV
jgi:predicted aldo/keto reductase-like oxidoreductase